MTPNKALEEMHFFSNTEVDSTISDYVEQIQINKATEV